MIHFQPDLSLVLWLLVTVILPILVGLVTTKDTSAARKAILLATLALAAGILAQLLAAIQAGIPYDLFSGLIQALATFFIAVASHFGFWKPTGVATAVQGIGRTSPDIS